MTFGNILTAIKLAIPIGLMLAVLWFRHEASTERQARIVAQQSIEAIKGAQRASEALETARNARVEADQARINEHAAKNANARLADLRAKYDSLRAQGAGSAPDHIQVPELPEPAGIADGSPGHFGLLDILQAADENTARLIELQDWIRAQSAVPVN